MSFLEDYVLSNSGRLIHKWLHYLGVYERHLAPFRGKRVSILEFGVFQGGSLEMWHAYFGEKATVYGVDINPHCKELEDERTKIFVGDQEDRAFLRTLVSELPRIDVVIDDGGHKMKQQIATFEEIFPHVSSRGIYICEDLQTSYWREYGGGVRRSGSFMEYSKRLIDQLNAWFSRQPKRLAVCEFTRSAASMHFYPGICVIEKAPVSEPQSVRTGTSTVPSHRPPRPLRARILRGLVRRTWALFCRSDCRERPR